MVSPREEEERRKRPGGIPPAVLLGASRMVPELFGSATTAAQGLGAIPSYMSGAQAGLESVMAGPTIESAALQGLPSMPWTSPLGSWGLPVGALGAYQAYQGLKKGKPMQSGIGGAMIGASIGGPPGALIGGVVGGAGGLISGLFDKDMYKTEGDRLRKLQEAGVNIPKELSLPMNLTAGRSKEELVAQERAKEAAGQYSNVKFAQSRNEADLKPEDIWGYSAFLKKDPEWLTGFSEDDRRKVAQKALDLGLVREHHGTIDIGESPELDEFMQGVKGVEAAAPTEAGQRRVTSEGRRKRRRRREEVAPPPTMPTPQVSPPLTIAPPSARSSLDELAEAYARIFRENQQMPGTY